MIAPNGHSLQQWQVVCFKELITANRRITLDNISAELQNFDKSRLLYGVDYYIQLIDKWYIWYFIKNKYIWASYKYFMNTYLKVDKLDNKNRYDIVKYKYKTKSKESKYEIVFTISINCKL